MTQFPKSLGLDLPDPFPGDIKVLPHFFEGVIGFFIDAETHLQDFLFRGVSVDRTRRVCSERFSWTTASEGATTFLSSIKSPR